MSLIDELEEEYAARYRADQFAAALRSRGCPEACIPTFLADREEHNLLMTQPYDGAHYCCGWECLELVPRGVLFCEVHQAEINERRRKARSRWCRLFRWLMEGM